MPEFSSEAATLDLPRLRAAFDGRVIGPGDPGYDQARALFYGGWDRRPGAIVRPADPAQVAQVVTMARDLGLELAVRGGGHSNAGHSTTDGGIVLDLSELTALDIDVDGRTAWAEGGLTAYRPDVADQSKLHLSKLAADAGGEQNLVITSFDPDIADEAKREGFRARLKTALGR